MDVRNSPASLVVCPFEAGKLLFQHEMRAMILLFTKSGEGTES